MKIVILSDRIPPENVGGAGRVAWALAVGLHAVGHEVHVIAATRGPSFEQTREGIATYHLHARYPDRFVAWLSLANPQTMGPLRQLLERLRPDVLNAHNIHHDLSYASLGIARRLGIPTVFTAHDAMTFAYGKVPYFVGTTRLPSGYNARQMRLRYNPLRNVLIRHMLARHALQKTCVSEAQRAALSANGLDGFQVVYNGVDPALYRAPPGAVAKYRAQYADRPLVLFAGRLSREKGSDLLIEAFARVHAALPAVLLLILAPGSQVADQAIAARPELRDAIRFGGWLSGQALITAFCAADMVTVPSVFLEGLPMVALEAMAARKPVVASPFGGLPEVVFDGETGYIVDPFDTAALADRLARVLSDPGLARRMGDAGYARLLAQFTLDRQVTTMEHLYGEILNDAHP